MAIIQAGPVSQKPVFNGEVASLIQMLDQIMRDAAARPFADDDNVNDTDLSITKKNWDVYKATYGAIQAQPEMYTPNVDEVACDVPDPPEITVPENPIGAMWCRFLMRKRMQLRNGESKNRASGVNPDEHDTTFVPMMAKMDQYLADAESQLTAGLRLYTPDVDDQTPQQNEPGEPA